MCGIFCALSQKHHVRPSNSMQQLLKARGPDAVNNVDVLLDERIHAPYGGPAAQKCHVSCYSTVLSLRGPVVVSQPHQSEDASTILCWNGEAWNIRSSLAMDNDTIFVHELLRGTRKSGGPSECHDVSTGLAEVVNAMSGVAGPYAFVFLDKTHAKMYLGRDFLGRRSLLRSTSQDGSVLLLSSVVDPNRETDWIEVEADGVYCIDLGNPFSNNPSQGEFVEYWGKIRVTKAPYITSASLLTRNHTSVIPTISLNRQVTMSDTILDHNSVSVAQLLQLLRDSLTPRIMGIPEPPREYDGSYGSRRSSLAILFSGGLDCTILARISHDLLPPSEPIDLLNVAFENPRIHKSPAGGPSHQPIYELCPDRITGRASYDELREVCPGRQWRFVAINVPYSETQEHRDKVITLMHPHNTEMDLSISLAFYFAARGSGVLSDLSDNPLPYTTAARVLLSGLGADELFAGYVRHATAFRRDGFTGLLDELELDIGRLGKRNLGRDDRVISNWAREARFPFLDEALVRWALAQPVGGKCGFGQVDESSAISGQNPSQLLEPGKKVLRCLALKLGMERAAKEKKRAIQFGARTAKMETGRTKGTHVLTA